MGALTSKPYAFTARPWELRSMESVDVFDSSLGKVRFDYRSASILRVLPVVNELGNQDWISDKVRFFYDSLHFNRLSTPWIRYSIAINYLKKNGVFPTNSFNASSFPVSWLFAGECLFFALGSLSYLSHSYGLSGILPVHAFSSSTSDLAALESLKSFVLQSGSRACVPSELSDSMHYNSDFRNSYISDFASIWASDLLLFAGLGVRYELPLFNLRVRELILQGRLEVGGFFFGLQPNYEVSNFGSSVADFLQFMSGRSYASHFVGAYGTPSILFGSSFFQHTNFSNPAYFRQFLDSTDFCLGERHRLHYLPSHSSTPVALETGFGLGRQVQVANSLSGLPNVFLMLESESIDLVDYPPSSLDLFFAGPHSGGNSFDNLFFSIVFDSHGDSNASSAHFSFPLAAYTEKTSAYISYDGKFRFSSLVLRSSHQLSRTEQSIFCIIGAIFAEFYDLHGLAHFYGWDTVPGCLSFASLPIQNFFIQPWFVSSFLYDCKLFVGSPRENYFSRGSVVSSSQVLSLAAGLRFFRFSNFN